NLVNGSVEGLVRSNCCNVTTNGTDLSGGAQSVSSGLSITGGTIAGDFSSPNNPANFVGVTMTGGTINAGTVNFTDSALGSASSPVTVDSRFGLITLNNTGVDGDFNAPGFAEVVLNGHRYGIC